jgi:hypothetical protein
MTPDSPDKQIDAGFAQMYQGLKRANAALIEVNAGFDQTLEGLRAAYEGHAAARVEREDLRETVHRLEELVLQLVVDVRALRERDNGHGGA